MQIFGFGKKAQVTGSVKTVRDIVGVTVQEATSELTAAREANLAKAQAAVNEFSTALADHEAEVARINAEFDATKAELEAKRDAAQAEVDAATDWLNVFGTLKKDEPVAE